MATEYYIWAAGDPKAQAMLDAINNHPCLPITPNRRGYPDYSAKKVTKWAESLTKFVDGRIGFKRLPQNLLEFLEIDEDEQQTILALYDPEIIAVSDLPWTVEQQLAEDNTM